MNVVARGVKRILNSKKQLEGGGFTVRRALGGAQLDQFDPFLLLDHFGPVHFDAGQALGAPDHPHRGFETVSYMLKGAMQHKDSHGNTGNIGPGDVQWMTAGAGVVHAEMPGEDIMKNGGDLEGFQLWVNLPKAKKMTKPRYQEVVSARIPEVTTEDGKTTVRIIAGESMGKSAIIDTVTPIMYLDIRVQANAEFEQPVPADYNAFVYVYKGSGTFGKDNTKAQEGQFLVLDQGSTLKVTAGDTATNFLLIGGTPIGEQVARYGPFVMNTQEELMQAFEDFQNGRMGEIDGAEERFAQTAAAKQAQKNAGRRNEL